MELIRRACTTLRARLSAFTRSNAVAALYARSTTDEEKVYQIKDLEKRFPRRKEAANVGRNVEVCKRLKKSSERL
jgi:hypothetical protein